MTRVASLFAFQLASCVLLATVFLRAQDPSCPELTLSSEQVKQLIDRARETRTDLTAPFPDYSWSVRRQRCYYIYTEVGRPEAPDKNNVFWINQHGQIVDMRPGNMTCPAKEFTLDEVKQIVTTARAQRSDLPRPFANARAQMTRTRCLYFYSEFALPDTGQYQVFTIDPYGGLFDAFRNRP
jgi:hypothetical protein